MKADNWKFVAQILLALVVHVIVALTYLHENFARIKDVDEIKRDIKAFVQQSVENDSKLTEAFNKNTQAIIRLEETIKRLDK